MGSDEIVSNFGATLILASLIFIVMVILILFAVFISRTEERKEWLKSKIFYNPFIRYAFLNALKFNMASMLAFKRKSTDTPSIIVAVLLFIVI